MDGYSVNEAAAVLGIPEGRVWELLARGVLSGSTEVGGDMRVFLRGTALAEAAPATRPNGESNGGNGGARGEMSAFRELLTEFRNLTERYGQALLALGEARGEVASLRGRVDLLEARLDNRVPWTAPAPAAWAPAPAPEIQPDPEPESEPIAPEPEIRAEAPEPEPAQTEAAPEVQAALEDSPSLDLEPEAEPEAEAKPESEREHISNASAPDLPDLPEESIAEALTAAEVEPIGEPIDESPAAPEPAPAPQEPHRSTGHSQARAQARAAVAGFAEALARAEDPTTAEVGSGDELLPGSDELADAVAAYREDVRTDAEPRSSTTEVDETDEGLEQVVAENRPVVEVPASIVRPGYTTETPEPDWIAEEDLIVAAGQDSPAVDDWSREGLVEDEGLAAEIEPEIETDPEPEPMAEAVHVPAEVPVEAAEAAEIAGDEAGAEIAAAFDPWPVHDEDAADGPPTEDGSEEASAGIQQPEPAISQDATEEPDSEVVEPAAYAEIPIEPDTEDDAWELPDVSLVPAAREPQSVPAAEPEAWPAEDVDPGTEKAVGRVADEVAASPPEPAPWGRIPVEIAAEPPGEDDAALLVAPTPDPVAFAEPPILPQEPAFWEPGARERAPFAIPHADPWEPAAAQTASVETTPTADLPAPASPPPAPPSPSVKPPAASPPPSGPRPASARRRRGPAARAIRRLRYLID